MVKYMAVAVAVAVAVSGGGAAAVAVPVAGLSQRLLITSKKISQSMFGVTALIARRINNEKKRNKKKLTPNID